MLHPPARHVLGIALIASSLFYAAEAYQHHTSGAEPAVGSLIIAIGNLLWGAFLLAAAPSPAAQDSGSYHFPGIEKVDDGLRAFAAETREELRYIEVLLEPQGPHARFFSGYHRYLTTITSAEPSWLDGGDAFLTTVTPGQLRTLASCPGVTAIHPSMPWRGAGAGRPIPKAA